MSDGQGVTPFDFEQSRREFVMLREISRALHCRPEEAPAAVRALMATAEELRTKLATQAGPAS